MGVLARGFLPRGMAVCSVGFVLDIIAKEVDLESLVQLLCLSLLVQSAVVVILLDTEKTIFI